MTKVVVSVTLVCEDPNILQLLEQFNSITIKDAQVVDVDLVSIDNQMGLAVTHVSDNE